jgi:hypothetical protein
MVDLETTCTNIFGGWLTIDVPPTSSLEWKKVIVACRPSGTVV